MSEPKELHVSTLGTCLTVQHFSSGYPCVVIAIDTDNLCVDNNYNGDHAYIDMTIEQVKELHDYLAVILEQ